MKRFQARLIIIFIIITVIFPCHAQSLTDSVAESHIDGNVPDAVNFNAFMERDLQAYFTTITNKSVKVVYELLRDKPTQTGIAYPKYYAWVKVTEGETLINEGAVRLTAIQKQRFEVTDFLSADEMKKDTKIIFRVFPKPVGDKILSKLKE